MHVVQTVCSESGQIASQYCPYAVQKGVIRLPQGHPLYKFIGTSYEDVLADYLGSASAVSGTCTLHTASNGGNTLVQNTLIPDAWLLINQAEGMLANMNSSSAQYQAILSAMNNLQSVITTGSPSQSAVATAMGQLTRAMAGLY